MRVLVALNGITFTKNLESLLSEWGFEPQAVGDPQSLQEALQQADPPPIAIIEWNAPHAELCRRLKQVCAGTPPHVIILSSAVENREGVDGLDAGTYDFLSKPWEEDKLKARIRVAERMVQLQVELDRSREALGRTARQDAVTGALNRAGILDELQREIARSRRMAGGFSIGLIAVDRFQETAAPHGPQAGGELLAALARSLRANLRGYDSVGCLEDGTFLVIAPGSAGTREEGVYERLCNNIGMEPVFTTGGLIVVSVSIGVVAGGGDASADALLTLARNALTQAVSAGGNRVAYSD